MGGSGREVRQKKKARDDKAKTALPVQALIVRLAADIIGGQPSTILRDGMPDKLYPGIYIWRNPEH